MLRPCCCPSGPFAALLQIAPNETERYIPSGDKHFVRTPEMREKCGASLLLCCGPHWHVMEGTRITLETAVLSLPRVPEFGWFHGCLSD